MTAAGKILPEGSGAFNAFAVRMDGEGKVEGDCVLVGEAGFVLQESDAALQDAAAAAHDIEAAPMDSDAALDDTRARRSYLCPE